MDLSPLTLLYSQQNAHPLEDDVGISGPSFDQVAIVVEVAECELHPFVPHHSVADLGFCKKTHRIKNSLVSAKNFNVHTLHKKKTVENILFLPEPNFFCILYFTGAASLANDIETGLEDSAQNLKIVYVRKASPGE